ncbi:MAG: RlmE family RNA methyltransferase [Spirochaetaceae bacterium]|jgi:23S rRNA (uridine2552-2'-O)-methyltransferase|nr:RlmE family RNA methyltransferase [Spirochaetaceae bacterium]
MAVKNYDKPDFWTQKARKEGYPARSVYKLKELNEKFALIPPKCPTPFKALDLGAAPGSWSLFLLRTLRSNAFLVACDLKPLLVNDADQAGMFIPIIGDFTSEPVRTEIIQRGPYQLVVSDAAPSTSGNRFLDTQRSLELAEAALSLADAVIAPEGHCVIKVFQGEESARLLTRLKEKFNKVKTFKPVACRSSSFETYLVALGKH